MTTSKTDSNSAKLFRAVHTRFSRLYSNFLVEEDLTLPQYALLTVLKQFGDISMTEASLRLKVTKPAVTQIVDKLEKIKYIKRITHPEDRRSYLLQILKKGDDVVKQGEKLSLDVLLKTLGEYSPAEQRSIESFYCSLLGKVDVVITSQEEDGK